VHAGLAAWALCTVLALTWPVYDVLGNHIDPLVAGLPFSLFWVLAWTAVSFVVLGAYDLWRQGRG